MIAAEDIFEKHVFFSRSKERTVFSTVLERVFPLQLDSIRLEWEDRPDETFSSINERTQKILMNLPQIDRLQGFTGEFAQGGTFALHGGSFGITIPSDQYNFELIDSLKNFLSPIFPVNVFQNPYIWGVNLFDTYDRDHFFEIRRFSARSRLLEDPEVDIFRRDDGIIMKLRFHLKADFELDEGIRFLEELSWSLLEAFRKRAYEGLEVLHMYCTALPAFRRLEPRTKLGRELKSLLKDH
jgi:hypothetical protein